MHSFYICWKNHHSQESDISFSLESHMKGRRIYRNAQKEQTMANIHINIKNSFKNFPYGSFTTTLGKFT